MRVALDTNRYTDLMRGLTDDVQVVATASAVYLPFPVVSELHIGFRRGSRRAANEALLQGFLSRPDVHVLYADAPTVEIYADLWCELLANGTPLPMNDVWIAALAIQHALPLFTRDKHFDRLPQVPRI